MLETRLRNTTNFIGNSIPSGTTVSWGTVLVQHDDGTETFYKPTSDTDSARGTALQSAFTAHASSDLIIVGPGTYTITTALTLLGAATIRGIGRPKLRDTTLTEPLLRTINNGLTIEDLDIVPNSCGVGFYSLTSQTVNRLVMRNVQITPGNTSSNAVMFSALAGGGSTEHSIVANFFNSKLHSGSISGYGHFACLNSGGINHWNCDIYGNTDGVLFVTATGTGNAVSNIFGGDYKSTLDAITSGGGTGNVINVYGVKARGDQADLYGDDGRINAYWCDVRTNYVVGNGINFANNSVIVGNAEQYGGQIKFTAFGGSPDSGLDRVSAGVLKVTDGASGVGRLEVGPTAICGGSMFVSTTSAGNVGTGEDNLTSFIVPANTLSANLDYLTFGASGTIATSINAKRMKAYLGSHVIFDTGVSGIPISAAIQWDIEGTIIRVNSGNQKCSVKMNTNNSSLASYVQFTVTTHQLVSTSQLVKLTGEATANSEIAQETMMVSWFPGNT